MINKDQPAVSGLEITQANEQLSSIQPLDLTSFPLFDHSLIEASAGTGKTYTIAELYQRCLIGHRHQLGNIGCQNILLVTFTRAATEELRGRIRQTVRLHLDQLLRLQQRLEQSDNACLSEFDPTSLLLQQGDTPDQQQARWLDWLLQTGKTTSPDLTELIAWLQVNLNQMDEASIFTIHGFCQRMLKQFAFDSRVLFDAELVLDSEHYLQQACEDIWRREGYQLDLVAAQFVRQQLGSPELLKSTLRSWFGKFDQKFRSGDRILDSTGSHWSESASKLQQLRQKIRQQLHHLGYSDIHQMISQSGINKRSYSKKNTPKWLTGLFDFFNLDIQNKSQTDKDDSSQDKPNSDLAHDDSPWIEKPTAEVERFRQSVIKNQTAKGEAAEHVVFDLLDQYCIEFSWLRGRLLYQWYIAIQSRYIELLETHSVMTPDDLLRLLANALRQENLQQDSANIDGSSSLADQIRQCYPLAMIDEFQDTDSLQYEIFSTIYQRPVDGNKPSIAAASAVQAERSMAKDFALILIGDPKQAIYRFRGADIYTYLTAKQAIAPSSRFTLMTNYRSQPQLVSALNSFWGQCQQPFLDDKQIPYQQVAAGRSMDSTVVKQGVSKNRDSDDQTSVISDFTKASLRVFEDSPASIDHHSKSSEQQRIAQQCAQHIAALLSGDLRADGSNTNNAEPLQAKDIAILVYSSAEASVLGDALATEGVGSVFLSRDSVFASQQAEDLLLWMQAVTSAGNDFAIRSAILTPTHGTAAHELAQINANEDAWENELQRFAKFQQTWLVKGIMAAILDWLGDTDRAQNIRRQKEGERSLTNLLHLGEILQQNSRLYPGQQGLIRYLSDAIQQSSLGNEEAQLRLESDSNLVQIVTIHKSKGLEYPHVFLPFLWGNIINQARPAQTRIYQYFDDQYGSTIQIGDEDSSSHRPGFAKGQQERDSLAEWLRLIYVAMTRARESLTLWLSHSPANRRASKPMMAGTALGYLLKQAAVCEGKSEGSGVTNALNNNSINTNSINTKLEDENVELAVKLPNAGLNALSEHIFYNSWQHSIGRQLSSVSRTAGQDAGIQAFEKNVPTLDANQVQRPWQRRLDNRWRVTSFSSLTAKKQYSAIGSTGEDPTLNSAQEALSPKQWEAGEQNLAVMLAATATNDSAISAGINLTTDRSECDSSDSGHGDTGYSDTANDPETQNLSLAATTARDFFRGAQAGTCLHGIFEYWDFHTEQNSDDSNGGNRLQVKSESLSVAVAQQLQQFGYSTADWQAGIEAWFKQVVNYPLVHEFGQCRLVDIDLQKRLDELEFCLPLGDLNHSSINKLIMQGDLNFTPTSGYLKGFIDLIFEHQGRYFVLDYKSNQLGEEPAAYHPAAMTEAMASHHYDAQAWIYTLALDQFLSARLPDYDPQQHLGGVFYCFIRAMVDSPDIVQQQHPHQRGEQHREQSGVHYIAPNMQQLRAWRQAILPQSATALEY